MRRAAIDSSNRQWDGDLIAYNRDLAVNGDDPAGRFAFIAAKPRKLKLDHALTAEETGWLVEAEQQLAKLKAQ